MTKPMKYRDLAKALRKAGFQPSSGKGDHEKWTAPDGTHVTITRDHRSIPGGDPASAGRHRRTGGPQVNITVTARRWDGGWELILDDHHATQVRTLDRAAQQVRDYLDTDDSAVDHSQWDVRIVLDDDDLATRLDAARAATAAAAIAQSEAAAASRIVVRDLRARGVSVTDCAALLGLSRGRISQLSA